MGRWNYSKKSEADSLKKIEMSWSMEAKNFLTSHLSAQTVRV